MIPTTCEMPELAPNALFGASVLTNGFIGNPGLTDPAVLYRKNFIRLVEKAGRHYRTARELVLAEISEQHRSYDELMEEGQFMYMFRFVDEIEDCLLACRRALRFLDLLKGDRSIGGRIDRTARRLLGTKDKSIKGVRNTIEHMATEISKGSLQTGQFMAPFFSDDGRTISVGDQSLKVRELASIIAMLQDVGFSLLGIPQNRAEI